MIEKTDIEELTTGDKWTSTPEQAHIMRLHYEVQELNGEIDQIYMALSEIMDRVGLGTVSRYLETEEDKTPRDLAATIDERLYGKNNND